MKHNSNMTYRSKAVWMAPIIVIFLTSCASNHVFLSNDHSILNWMKREHVPTVGICVIENASIKQVRVFGDIEYHAPAPLNTLFNIASLTKPLLSMTTLKLVSKRQWQLDEPLYHYWTDPDVAADSLNRKLTTRHVLSHQSGLPNWRGHEPDGKLSFAFEPGTQWKYSGEGFEYLRQALEHKFNMPVERLVDSILFKPLGMKNTRFFWDNSMDTTLYADRYDANGQPYEKERWYAANASNLVLTTVEDYGKFGIAILKGNFLSPEVQHEMIQKQALLENGIEVGLGWFMIKNLTQGGYVLYHSGSNRGQNTKIFLLPESKNGIIIFTNGENGNKICERIIAEYVESGKEILNRLQ